MIYFHCGWLKTGTTSLQAALYRREKELEAAGLVIVRPSKILPKRLNGPEADDAIAEFVDELGKKADRELLVSCETFMNMMITDRQQDVFLRLIDAVQAITPVRCLWTLRRWDEMVRSYYLWQLSYGLEPPSFLEYLEGLPPMNRIFRGLHRVNEVTIGDALYFKYDATGGHNTELLDSIGVPKSIGQTIEKEMMKAPYRNVAPSYKEAIVLLNADRISRAIGIEMRKPQLLEMFALSDFQFSNDRRCELMDLNLKRHVHEEMLRFARQADFEAYLVFYENAEIASPAVADPLVAEVLVGEDLRLLAARLERSTGDG